MGQFEYIYNKVWRCVLLLTLLASHAVMRAAQREELLSTFTKDNPMVVVTLYNNAPYEFSDSKNLSNGYVPDVIRAIAKRLHIEIRFETMDWNSAKAFFESGNAHLIMLPEDVSINGEPTFGNSIIAPVHVGLACNRDLGEIDDLTQMMDGVTVFVSQTGLTIRKLAAAGLDTTKIEYAKTADVLEELNSGAQGYLLGNELNMSYWIRKQDYSETISLKRLTVAASCVRFCSYNPLLVSILDEEYGHLEQKGVIEDLQTKWFYPERSYTDARGLLYTFLSVGAVLLLVVLLFNRVVVIRMNTRAHSLRQARRMMEAAIRMDGRDVIAFDIQDMEVNNISGHFLPDDGVIQEQFLEHVHPDDRPLVYGHIRHMSAADSSDVFSSPVFRWSPDANPDGPWHSVMLQSVLEFTPDGRRTLVVSTVSDITEELARTEEEEDTSEMFRKIFDNGVLGMAIYTPSGEMQEVNRRMCDIFHIPVVDNKPSGYFFGNNLYKMPSMHGVLDPINPQELWVCTRIHLGSWSDEAFVELHITPVHDNNGKLAFILVSVRDITDDVKTFRERKGERARLHEADRYLKQREEEMRILMQSSRMRLWRVSEQNKTISFFHSPDVPESVMSWDEFLDHSADESSRDNMLKLLQSDTSVLTEGSVQVAMNNLLGTYDDTQWYAFSVLGRSPVEEKGEEMQFGLTLNITANVLAQRSFEAEKQRATESEHQKTVFLNSMAHEIRTPLNSIVGFSEMLPMLEGEEREMIITTIKQNCDKLLRLTDDILTISAMDAKELTFTYSEVDFAKAFDEEYENLRIYTDPNSNVQYLKDNPFDTLMVRIDMNRISQILTNFLGNAVKYTTEGFIKIGYSCSNDTLRIYCQDTGRGISKAKQKSVFERFFQADSFVQGTGMGLSVCKSIAEAMGGRIGVESEEGKGATFYVEIPQNGGG